MITDYPAPEPVICLEKKKLFKGAFIVLGALASAAGIIWGLSATTASNQHRLSRVEESAIWAAEVPIIKKDIEVLKDALMDVRNNTRRTNELLVDILRQGAFHGK